LTGLARCNGDKFTTEYSVRSIGLAFPRHWLFLAEAQLGLAGGGYLFIGMECDGAPLTWLYDPYSKPPKKDGESVPV
jgi:hypothetical protein